MADDTTKPDTADAAPSDEDAPDATADTDAEDLGDEGDADATAEDTEADVEDLDDEDAVDEAVADEDEQAAAAKRAKRKAAQAREADLDDEDLDEEEYDDEDFEEDLEAYDEDDVEESVDVEDLEEDDEEDEEDEASASSHRATVEELLKAGTHFGHLTSRWNPRMENYIFMERNNIHIIDLMQTQVLLDKAASAAKRFARRGKKILFAGTKKQAKEIVREHAESCGMPFMVDRWMGGTMTNFQTIRKSIRRMEEIERMEKDGTLDKLKKKEKLMRLREHEKLENTLGGIRNMANLPGAIYIVDVKREDIAVSEAQKLGIPIIAMVDTNGNPNDIDYPVPANDDALSSIELVTSVITDAIQEGLHERKMKQEAKKKQAATS